MAAATGATSFARFYSPQSVAIDSSGNVYVADAQNSTIRKITLTGVVSVLAGSAGVLGSADGTGASAQFSGPQGVAVDIPKKYLYSGYGKQHTIPQNYIWRGVVTTVAAWLEILAMLTGWHERSSFTRPRE